MIPVGSALIEIRATEILSNLQLHLYDAADSMKNISVAQLTGPILELTGLKPGSYRVEVMSNNAKLAVADFTAEAGIEARVVLNLGE